MLEKLQGAFVGFGEVNTPRDVLEEKTAEAARRLTDAGLSFFCTPLVTDNPDSASGKAAGEVLRSERFSYMIVCVAGWVPTHAVIDVILPYRNIPIILWGLSGRLEDGRLVTTADQAGTSAMRKVLADMDFNFVYTYNYPCKWNGADRVVRFAKAACAADRLKTARVGMMGYRDMKLYGTLFDASSLRAKIGPDIECFEMLELVMRSEKYTEAERRAFTDEKIKSWSFQNEADESVLLRGAGYYLALRDIVRERGYEAMSLIDVDGMKKLLSFPPAMLFMLLAQELELCTVPENDSLGAVTQLMCKYLTGQISAYMEFYEFFEDRVLMGVPDFVPPQVVDGDFKVMYAAFGDIGGGVMNISTVKGGPVTIFRLTGNGNNYQMHMAYAQAKPAAPWEEVGWTQPAPQLPGLEVFLGERTEHFTQNVMSQHYIVTYGDNRAVMRDICSILGVEVLES